MDSSSFFFFCEIKSSIMIKSNFIVRLYFFSSYYRLKPAVYIMINTSVFLLFLKRYFLTLLIVVISTRLIFTLQLSFSQMKTNRQLLLKRLSFINVNGCMNIKKTVRNIINNRF